MLAQAAKEPRKDFKSRHGSTLQGCCVAKYCPAVGRLKRVNSGTEDICDNITGWDKNPATGLKG